MQRTHFTAGYTQYNCVCDKKNIYINKYKYLSYKSSDNMTTLPTKHPSPPSAELWGQSGHLLQGHSAWSKCHITSVWRVLSQRCSVILAARGLRGLKESRGRKSHRLQSYRSPHWSRRCWRAAPTIPCRCIALNPPRVSEWREKRTKMKLRVCNVVDMSSVKSRSYKRRPLKLP